MNMPQTRYTKMSICIFSQLEKCYYPYIYEKASTRCKMIHVFASQEFNQHFTKQHETFDQQVMPSNKQIIGAAHYYLKGNHNTMKLKTQENIKGATNNIPFLVAELLQIIGRIELHNSPLECKERKDVMVHNRGDNMHKGKKCGQWEMTIDSSIHNKP